MKSKVRPINVLALFDGMSVGYLALRRAGIPVRWYVASEIDKYAIQISQKNFHRIKHIGDVQHVVVDDLPFTPDLIIAGSPCQGFSFAGKQLAFDDPRSKLFFEFVRIYRAIKKKNPDVKFLLENVRMKKPFLEVISKYMGVDPLLINSALVSAQNRERYYWANWPIIPPADRRLILRDIIEEGAVDREKSYCIDANYHKGQNLRGYFQDCRRQIVFNTEEEAEKARRRQIIGVSVTENGIRPYKNDGRKGSLSEIGTIGTPSTKSTYITATHVPKIIRAGTALDIKGHDYNKRIYALEGKSPTLPDNYTAGVSNAQRYKMLGNGWTLEIIAHIFRCLGHHLWEGYWMYDPLTEVDDLWMLQDF